MSREQAAVCAWHSCEHRADAGGIVCRFHRSRLPTVWDLRDCGREYVAAWSEIYGGPKLVGDVRDPCFWHPAEERPCTNADPWHADADLIVGANGHWRLCRTCAALHRFNRYRVRRAVRCQSRGCLLTKGHDGGHDVAPPISRTCLDTPPKRSRFQ